MIDPSIIDELLQVARDRDQACTFRLQNEIARLPITSADAPPHDLIRPTPADGSYAVQLWSAICFMVDARAELKLLELIASPNFYAALMRSAAETPE